MATIGFIGLGNMGAPMAANLLKSQHKVTGYDVVAGPAGNLELQGGKAGSSVAEVAAAGDIVVTMLPAGPQVRQVYLGPDGIIAKARKGALLIDCSTIDVETARAVAAAAAEAGFQMLDAPVSGGVMGAQGATLTFMVGGPDAAFRKGRPILANMGRTIVHAGPSGNGQIAKICNNMILACSMIAVCEGFSLAEKLGLSAQTLFDITSTSTSQCWAMNNYCPMPGPVPGAPSNRGYVAGFTAANMLKDLRLSQQAAGTAAAATPLGAAAANLYQLFVDGGMGGLDFSAIMQMIRRQGK
ncbi:MAG TPA: 3-hydroxyisobutyrate dehydrogenase [Stellaceae bacterium]|nr:3-hydroxyisobutyrate dehydrogenase [Stellaceae bacterium]